MTTKEAIYLLRNTAWLAPSLEPIDKAIDMACEALDKVEYINSQLGKPKDEPQTCDTCKFELYFPEICKGCCEWDSHYEPKEQSGKE